MPRRILNLFGDTVAGRIKLLGSGIVASLAALALGFTLVYKTNSAEALREQTHDNCTQIENLKGAIRDVLEDGKVRALGNNGDPAVEKAIVEYYDRQLARFARDECPNP